MGYSDIYLLYIIIGKINVFLGIGIVIGIVATVCTIILFFHYFDNLDTKKERDSKEEQLIQVKLHKKRITLSLISFLFFVFSFNLMPENKDAITYIVLKQIDNYGQSNKNSIANPKKIFKTVDDVTDFIDKVISISTKKLGQIETGIDNIEKRKSTVYK